MEAMEAFHLKCPEIGFDEYRSLTIHRDGELPAGEYAFVEFYCADPKCDCRRVSIAVVAPEVRSGPLATLSYGWEKPAFYRKWSRVPIDANEMAGASLNPLAPQSKYSETLLRLFEDLVLTEAYVERLKRHYDLFKKVIGAKGGVMDPEAEDRRRAARARLKKRRRKGR